MSQAVKIGENKAGDKIALVRDVDGFKVMRRAANYSRTARGGLAYTWRYIERGMSLEAATALFNRRAVK
jgi:hypothetical protein